VPDPVQAPDPHPAHGTHLPFGHCESAVHQHGMPDAVHVAVGEVTLSQLPFVQVHAEVADTRD
jgi:hypothetical protein